MSIVQLSSILCWYYSAANWWHAKRCL